MYMDPSLMMIGWSTPERGPKRHPRNAASNEAVASIVSPSADTSLMFDICLRSGQLRMILIFTLPLPDFAVVLVLLRVLSVTVMAIFCITSVFG